MCLIKKTIRYTIAFSAALALSACGVFSDSDPRYEPTPLGEYAPSISVSVAWTVPIGSGSGYGFAPILVDSYIYAATPSGDVKKVEAATGRLAWQVNVGETLSAGVGSDGETTAVVSKKGEIIALGNNGAEKWRAQATSDVNIAPVVGSGIVAVRSGDYRTQAFSIQEGEPLWSVQRPGPALALKTSMQMIIYDGMLVTGLPNGKLMAIHIPSGDVQWEGTVGTALGGSDLERISDVVGAPIVADPLLCAASYQGRISCFDISKGGDTAWSTNFSTNMGITANNQGVYAPSSRGDVYGFSIKTGEEIWQQRGLRNRRLSSPAIINQAVALGDLEGYVHFLSLENGNLLGRVGLDTNPIISPLLATNRGLVVQTGGGNLVMININ